MKRTILLSGELENRLKALAVNGNQTEGVLIYYPIELPEGRLLYVRSIFPLTKDDGIDESRVEVVQEFLSRYQDHGSLRFKTYSAGTDLNSHIKDFLPFITANPDFMALGVSPENVFLYSGQNTDIRRNVSYFSGSDIVTNKRLRDIARELGHYMGIEK